MSAVSSARDINGIPDRRDASGARAVRFRSEEPEFGHNPGTGSAPGPRQLYCALYLDPEEHVHLLEPAYRLVLSLLDRAPLPPMATGSVDAVLDALVAWGRESSAPAEVGQHAPSWPARVVRELSPVGLADGAWLRGAARTVAPENELGACLLEQLALRFGDPARSEGYPYRFGALLMSVGVPAGAITRWEWDETVPCTDLSYERGLLGLGLGLFPSTLLPETLGFNLWMASIGPAPLLARLTGSLEQERANLRYFERYSRSTLTRLARRAVHLAVAEPAAFGDILAGVARGFGAAQHGYGRWEQAMRGANIALTAWDSVVEMVRRKARFAAAHHDNIHLAKRNVERLIEEGGSSHEWLVERMAKSPMIRAGDPKGSRFITHTLSIDGPMFDAFTAREKLDLQDWVRLLGTPAHIRTRVEPVSLDGRYVAAQDPAALEAFAERRYGELSDADLLDAMRHADRHPTLALVARRHARQLLAAWEGALSTDSRLAAQTPPAYTEEAVIALARLDEPWPLQGPPEGPGHEVPAPVQLDGAWLAGFNDLRRSSFDDVAWAFSIYRSTFTGPDWVSCYSRRARAAEQLQRVLCRRRGPEHEPLDARRLAIGALGLSLNAVFFTPELLGIELALARTRPRDTDVTPESPSPTAAAAQPVGEGTSSTGSAAPDTAVLAAYAFMKRVRDAAPHAVERQWRRLWRAWRAVDVLATGDAEERAALLDVLSVPAVSGCGRATTGCPG